jgi:cytochrome c biogenesis protein CcdA
MVAETTERALSEKEVIRSVRWRFRICNYLFNLGFVWIFVGILGLFFAEILHANASDSEIALAIELVGFGIFSAAFALTLAIYRCPVCDKYLSRFRPRKEYCPSCGAKIRETK